MWTRALLFLLLPACGQLPTPQTLEPPPPQPRGSTCETTSATLESLGGCGLRDGFLKRCYRDVQSQAVVGASPPLDCQTAAKSCGEFVACR